MLEVYKNPSYTSDERTKDLLSRMTMEEKIGQHFTFFWRISQRHGDEYIEMTNEPLFPFGFGLSYTHYEYSNLKVFSRKLKATDDLSFSVDVHNAGNYEGTEIVQLYINDIFSSVTTPIKELKGFKRVTLKPGENYNSSFFSFTRQ